MNQENNQSIKQSAQSTDQQPAPQPTDQPQSFLSKLNWKYIGIGLVVVLVFGVGAFWVGKNNTQKQKETVIPTVIQPIAISDTKELNNIMNVPSNWKKYTSEDYTFQYPPEMSLSTKARPTSISGVSVSMQGPTQKAMVKQGEMFDGVSFSVNKWSLSGGSAYNRVKSEYDFSKSECANSEYDKYTTDIEEIVIDDVKGYQFSTRCRGGSTYIALEKGEYIYDFILFYGSIEDYIQEYRMLAENMLSTFKFKTSSNSDNWQAYTSSCGFFIKYPQGWNASKFFIQDSEKTCVHITAPDYEQKKDLDHSGWFYLGVKRTMLGSIEKYHNRNKDIPINSLEDYITFAESVSDPIIPVKNKQQKTFGNFTGIQYDPIGFVPGRSFIFIKNGYIYEINWAYPYEGEYVNELEDIIKSTSFN